MTNNPFDLTGRRALVTGANTGLGQGMAIALAKAGAELIFLSIMPALFGARMRSILPKKIGMT